MVDKKAGGRKGTSRRRVDEPAERAEESSEGKRSRKWGSFGGIRGQFEMDDRIRMFSVVRRLIL